MIAVTVPSAEMMAQQAARFVSTLTPRTDGATVVTLRGELGAGKTAFVKGVAKALGVGERVTSPTFVIMKLYDLMDQPFARLVHIDAYRLKGEHHLRVLGWNELLADPRNLIFVEWPEQAGSAIPASALCLTFRYSEDDGREIIFEEEQKTVGTA